MVEGRSQGEVRVGERESILMIRPGEIYLASTDAGTRPVVVVSREELNRGGVSLAMHQKDVFLKYLAGSLP